MNKKTYIIPELQVMKIGVQQMLATSDEVGIGGNYGGGTIQAREVEFSFDGEY